MTAKAEKLTGLALLREPFPAHQVSKLPKPTKAQTDAVKADFKSGARCDICGTWHHPKVVHLDYVGHAALTDRLLDCDPAWNWTPMAMTDKGTPMLDQNGGMWISLTVCGVTRLGYGHADGKSGGDAVKEVIGDALRNAAMRFGAALDLWHKGELHLSDEPEPAEPKPVEPPPPSRADVLLSKLTRSVDRAAENGVSMDRVKTNAQYIADTAELRALSADAAAEIDNLVSGYVAKEIAAAANIPDEIPF